MKTILLSFIFCLIHVCVNAQPGTLDSSFGKNGVTINYTSGSCNAVALQHSGKSIVCGAGIVDNVEGLDLVRYNTDGAIDSTFGKNGYTILSYNIYGVGEFFCLLILNDDKLIAAGDINNDIALAKFNADGKLDSTFGKNGFVRNDFGFYEAIFAAQIQNDGKIVVAGEHSPNIYNDTGIVIRYLPNGNLDKSFGNKGQVVLSESEGISSIIIQKDGRIVIGGNANNTDEEFYVGRLNEDGSYDESFNKKGYVYTRFVKDHRDELHSLAIQPDGKIIGAGASDLYYGWDMGVVRYNTNGSLDSSFGTKGLQSVSVPDNAAQASTVLIQNNGKIILSGGAFNNDPLSGDVMLVRLNTNGNLDSSFGVNGISITNLSRGSDGESGAVLQSDGKIVVAGTSGFDNKNYDNIARFNNADLTKKQIIINKIKHYISTHNNAEAATLNNHITLYPNPVKDILTIKGFDAKNNYELSIINNKGNIVATKQVNNLSSYQFNIEKLSSGVYYVNVVANNKLIATLKFVKQ